VTPETAYLITRMHLSLIWEGIMHYPGPAPESHQQWAVDEKLIAEAVRMAWSKLEPRDRYTLRTWGPEREE
jgi:hypothetical protein